MATAVEPQVYQFCIFCEHMICDIHQDSHHKIYRPNVVSKLCTCLIQQKIHMREINGDTETSWCQHTEYHWNHPYFVGYDIDHQNETIEMWRINWETLDGQPLICTFSVNPKIIEQFNIRQHANKLQRIKLEQKELEQQKRLEETRKVTEMRKQKGCIAYKRIQEYEKIRPLIEEKSEDITRNISHYNSKYEKKTYDYNKFVELLKEINEDPSDIDKKMEIYLQPLLEVMMNIGYIPRRYIKKILCSLPKYSGLNIKQREGKREINSLISSILKQNIFVDYIINLDNGDKLSIFNYLNSIEFGELYRKIYAEYTQEYRIRIEKHTEELRKLQEITLSNRDEYPNDDCHFLCDTGSNFLLPPPNCGCPTICADCMIKHGGKCSSQSASCHNSLMRHLQNDVDYNDEHPTREPTRTYIVDFLEIDMFSIRELMRTHIDNVAGTAEHDEDDVDNAAGTAEHDEDDVDNAAGTAEHDEDDEDYVAGIVEFSELDVEVLANLRELVIEFFQHNKTDNEVDNLLMLAIFCNRCGYNEDYNFLFPLVGLR
jgi:hypothetical protein